MNIFNKISNFFDELQVKRDASKLGPNERELVMMVFNSIQNKDFVVESARYSVMEIRLGREKRDKFTGSYKIVFHYKDLSIAINCPQFTDYMLRGGYTISVYNKSKNEVKDYSTYRTNLLEDIIVSFLKEYNDKMKIENQNKDLSFLK